MGRVVGDAVGRVGVPVGSLEGAVVGRAVEIGEGLACCDKKGERRSEGQVGVRLKSQMTTRGKMVLRFLLARLYEISGVQMHPNLVVLVLTVVGCVVGGAVGGPVVA